MKFNQDWEPEDRKRFVKARRVYHNTDTKAARADKLTMLKEVLERTKNNKSGEGIDRLKERIKELKSKDE